MHPLKAYITENKLDAGEFASRVGTTPNHINRIMLDPNKRQSRHAGRTLMRNIAIETRGAVMPTDLVFPEGVPDFPGPEALNQNRQYAHKGSVLQEEGENNAGKTECKASQ